MPARKKMPHSTKDQLDTVEGAPVAFKNWGEALTQVARDRQAQGLPPIITDALILKAGSSALGSIGRRLAIDWGRTDDLCARQERPRCGQ